MVNVEKIDTKIIDAEIKDLLNKAYNQALDHAIYFIEQSGLSRTEIIESLNKLKSK